MLDTKKKAVKYGLAALICFVINLIYSRFSHNVSSLYMTYAFIIPIIGFLISLISDDIAYRNLLASATLTITLSSFLEGIVEIAGTETFYVYILLGIGIIIFIISFFYIKRKTIQSNY